MTYGRILQSAVGNMDGFFNGRRLFAAPHNGAVLVSGDRLRNPRSISILDEEPTFSAYGFPSVLDHYPNDYSSLRQVYRDFLSVDIFTGSSLHK